MSERALVEDVAVSVAPIGARLGEGPLWDPRIARLLFVDIKGEALYSYSPDTHEAEKFPVSGMISALAPARGGYICAYKEGFARLFFENGAARLLPLSNPERDLPGNRFNDGKADPAGGFWAGTMDDSEKSVSGSWWRLAPDGTTTRIDSGYGVTNGPAFDPERARVYVTDSAAQTVFVADTDGTDLRNKQVFLSFGAGDGYPDGMETDREGCLWIAFWDGACVRRFSPEGALIETLAVPVPRPTSIALAGDRLFVTSASIGLSQAERTARPLSGGLFEARLARPLAREKTLIFNG